MQVVDMSEGAFHFCGRFLVRLLVDFLFEMVCFWVGFVFLRLVTLGKYPPDTKEMFSDGFVSLVGGLVLLGLGLWFVF